MFEKGLGFVSKELRENPHECWLCFIATWRTISNQAFIRPDDFGKLDYNHFLYLSRLIGKLAGSIIITIITILQLRRDRLAG